MIYPDDGNDYAWIGVDSKNRVGLFSSGGDGPIPKNILMQNYMDFRDVEFEILEMPYLTSAVCSPKIKKLSESCVNFGRRGIAFYVWNLGDFSSNCYSMYLSPERPLYLNDLPEKIAKIADLVRFNDEFSKWNGFYPKSIKNIEWIYP